MPHPHHVLVKIPSLEDPCMPRRTHPLIAAHHAARRAILDHCGYTDPAEPWLVLPLEDKTDQYWYVQSGDPCRIYFSPDADQVCRMRDAIRGTRNNSICFRSDTRWYRGSDLVLAPLDVHCEDAYVLTIFSAAMEIKNP